MGHPGAYFEGRVYFIPGARGKFKSKALKEGLPWITIHWF